MRSLPQKLAALWITLISLGAGYGWIHQEALEHYALPMVLAPGFDAFGRNCMMLIFPAIAESVRVMLPTGVLCLMLSLFLSFFALLRSERLQLALRGALDTFSSLPGFLIALALGVLYPHSEFTFFLGALLLIVPSITRFFESQILKLREEDFIRASEALGARPAHLWIYHYWPELFRLLRSILPFLAMRLILLETSLSFLGLQAAPNHETWGRLLYQGKDYLLEAPWILGIAATPLCLTLIAFHLLSREDPH